MGISAEFLAPGNDDQIGRDHRLGSVQVHATAAFVSGIRNSVNHIPSVRNTLQLEITMGPMDHPNVHRSTKRQSHKICFTIREQRGKVKQRFYTEIAYLEKGFSVTCFRSWRSSYPSFFCFYKFCTCSMRIVDATYTSTAYALQVWIFVISMRGPIARRDEQFMKLWMMELAESFSPRKQVTVSSW